MEARIKEEFAVGAPQSEMAEQPDPLLARVEKQIANPEALAPPQGREQPAPEPQNPPLRQRWKVPPALSTAAKQLATVALALVAALVSLIAWDHYLSAPWTRDGRVRVQVASVAPEISGRIRELRVADNQFVHKGDILYVIDRFDFETALRAGKAALQQRAADSQVKELQAERQRRLSDTTTIELEQISAGNAIQAKAAFEAAQTEVAQAEINLQRTEVRSPVNGYVTNLLLRAGDYARQGVTNVSVIDTDSFWIDGYFEETKMAHVCTGSRVEAKLMGYQAPIIGHVKTITRGLSVSNAAAGTQGLPNVDPVYTWVRLAQRIPVRIAIDKVPPGVPLVSGMTATVTVREETPGDASDWFASARASIRDVLDGPSAQPNCLSTVASGDDPSQSVPEWDVQADATPQQVNPGFPTDIEASPRSD